MLYYHLVANASAVARPGLSPDWYETLLYWKLYSQPAAVSGITRLQGLDAKHLQQFLERIPETIPRQVSDIVELVELAGKYQIPGMKLGTALPVRSTVLHFLYPNIVPIFDQMVLKALGAWSPGANKNLDILCEYIPHAWALADQHTQQLTGFQETPLRLVDMALWVVRDKAQKAKRNATAKFASSWDPSC